MEMKKITKTATPLWCLGSVVRDVTLVTVATCPLSGTLGLSFRIFLGARWGITSETAAAFSLLAERQGGISVIWVVMKDEIDERTMKT
jgi:hypothetical protein